MSVNHYFLIKFLEEMISNLNENINIISVDCRICCTQTVRKKNGFISDPNDDQKSIKY